MIRACPPELEVPIRRNFVIAAVAILANFGLLWTAAHAPSWWITALAAFAFSFTNNTVFSLQHEAVHGSFHPDRKLNDAAGVLFAAFFPTIFAIQRISHLGHHRRNRTDQELYDYVLPGESWILKTYWIYCLLFGFYWMIIPVAMALYMIAPWAFRSKRFGQGPARWWGFEPFVADIAAAPVRHIWPQGMFTVALQAALFYALDLDFFSWLCCYWAFGINWSSVQYTDHAGSPRDVIEGAWNLRFTKPSQFLFLNYNLHLAHHREPLVPWVHLPDRLRPDDPSPSFWPIYLRLFLGARRVPTEVTAKPLTSGD